MDELNDDFLKQIGLSTLTPGQSRDLLDTIYVELELRVGKRLSADMSEAQLREFESIIDQDVAVIGAWLELHSPGFETDPVFKKFEQSMADTRDSITIVAEYAATRWLQLNRPDYREVVTQTLEELRQEIRHRVPEILASAMRGQSDDSQSTR